MSIDSDFFFRCKHDMDPQYCNMYEYDPESRGFLQGLAECASCKYREAINAKTAKAEQEWEEERSKPLW